MCIKLLYNQSIYIDIYVRQAGVRRSSELGSWSDLSDNFGALCVNETISRYLLCVNSEQITIYTVGEGLPPLVVRVDK